MDKKTFIATILACALLGYVGIQESAYFASASTNPWPPTADPTPPTLTVQGLSNMTTLIENKMGLDFTVTTPSSWKTVGSNGVPLGEVTSIQVCIDQNLVVQYVNGNLSVSNLPRHYVCALDDVPLGSHILNITVFSNSYYNPIFPHFHGDVASYPIVVSNTFTINVGSASPSPSTTSTPNPTQNNLAEWVYLTTITGNSSQTVNFLVPNLSHWRVTGGFVSGIGDSLVNLAYGAQSSGTRPFNMTKNANWWVGLEHTNASESGEGNIQLEITAENVVSYTLNVEYASLTDQITDSPSTTPFPTVLSSPSETPAKTPSIAPTNSPTQTATTEISPSPAQHNSEDDFAPLAIAVGLVVAVAVVGLMVYFRRRRGQQL